MTRVSLRHLSAIGSGCFVFVLGIAVGWHQPKQDGLETSRARSSRSARQIGIRHSALARKLPPPALSNDDERETSKLEKFFVERKSPLELKQTDSASKSLAFAEKCYLFPETVQDRSARRYSVEVLSPVLLSCSSQDGNHSRIAIRRLEIDEEPHFLVVDPATLHSEILNQSCLTCAQAMPAEVSRSRYLAAVSRTTQLASLEVSRSRSGEGAPESGFLNAGLRHAEDAQTRGVIVTGDLCPSTKPFDRGFIERLLARQPHPVALAFAVSGVWLDRNASELLWLKERVDRGELDAIWVNHSHRHHYRRGLPDRQNFLLLPGTIFESEVLEAERKIIASGLTPSIFFRFPGLVSSQELMAKLAGLSLIPLGSDAWISKGQRPSDGSIVLLHLNGNEPEGLRLFESQLERRSMPLPLLPVWSSVGP